MDSLVEFAPPAGKEKKLLDQMRDVLRFKHYSLRTEQTYCHWVERFIRFHKLRHPRTMSELEVAEFLTDLARRGQVAASTQNQHVKASLTCQERIPQAYNDVGNDVQTESDGDATFITSTGFSVRATPQGSPMLEPPAGLRTRINGTPGRVIVYWLAVAGAWNYAAQYTTDLTGATGWTDVPETTGKTKLAIDGLTSGTRYALRLRALNGGAVGPWSATIVQMAP